MVQWLEHLLAINVAQVQFTDSVSFIIMWVTGRFVGSLLCSVVFFAGLMWFSLFSKTNCFISFVLTYIVQCPEVVP